MARNRAINYRELKRMYELDPHGAHNHLVECLETKKLRPQDFSVRELAEAIVGREWVQAMNPAGGNDVALLEAAGAVSTNQFSNIFGQIIYSRLLDGFEFEDFVFSKAVQTVPSRFPYGERIPKIGDIGNYSEPVGEGAEYPLVGVNEDWIDAPAGQKFGMIIPLTKEAVYFDNTNSVLEKAGRIGEWMGYRKELSVIDAIIDENVTRHQYKWRGTTYGNFQSASPWINVKGSNALLDWTNVEAAWKLLAAILDPNTGTPVLVLPDTIIVSPRLLHTARRIVRATDVREHAGAYPDSGNVVETVSPSPLDNYNILTSRILPTRQTLDTSWYLGNVRRAVWWLEQWPITVVQAPVNNTDEFHRDIVNQWKASYRGVASVVEPRALCKNTAA